MDIKSNGTWMACNEACPECGSMHTYYEMSMVLASYPAQYHFKCADCGKYWTGRFDTNLGTIAPNVPSYEPPNIPYYELPKKNGSYGWICPVCGAGVSPYQDHCPCCGGKSLTPTWTCGGDNMGLAISSQNIATTKTNGEYNGNK